ncbi:MAG: hypothetical protein IH786_09970 [Proteobacteria bacterium]|nr:hypothetical protein [Pseudomonadota bacterium]
MAADPPIGPGTRRGAASASTSARDRPPARVAAFGMFLLAAGALAWMHRDDVFPPAALPADDPVALCVAGRWAGRWAGIDEMVADGTVDTARAELFKARAEALCQAQAGQGSGPPKLPGQ